MEKKKLRKLKPLVSDKQLEEMLPPYLREAFHRLEVEIKDKIKREIRSCFKEPELMNYLLENQSAHLSRFNRKTYRLFELKMESIVKAMEKIKNANEIVEESLQNMLLAIRQNEYLQAWYPAQQGHPEMKVVGPHPIQIARREEQKCAS